MGEKVGARGILRTSQDEDCPGQSSGPHMARRAEHGRGPFWLELRKWMPGEAKPFRVRLFLSC